MKNKATNLLKSMGRKLVAVAAVAVAAFTLAADAQSIPLKTYFLTNSTGFQMTSALALPTATSSNILSQPFQVWRGRGFAFNAGFYCTNASGSNVQFNLRFAATHKVGTTTYTNWFTTGTAAPMTFNVANNGTTEVFFNTNIPPTTLDNVDIGQLNTVTNQHLSTLFIDPTNTFISVYP